MVKGHYTCLCGTRGEVRQVKGRLAPYCPSCTYNFQSKAGQAALKEHMVPVSDEPVQLEGSENVEPVAPVMGKNELPETPPEKPVKKPFRLFG